MSESEGKIQESHSHADSEPTAKAIAEAIASSFETSRKAPGSDRPMASAAAVSCASSLWKRRRSIHRREV